jgi:hypothetical protein
VVRRATMSAVAWLLVGGVGSSFVMWL